MHYYSAVYKYIKQGVSSGYHIFSHNSEEAISKTKTVDLISELLMRKDIQFDSINLIWFESIDKNVFRNVELFDAEVITNILERAKQMERLQEQSANQ